MRQLLFLTVIFFLAHSAAGQRTAGKQYTIDDDFPGGNIVVDSIAGSTAFIHHDLADTRGNWFYWSFRVKGAAGQTITFQFTHPWGDKVSAMNVIGVRGPGISLDGGKTWKWMGTKDVEEKSFKYTFGRSENNVHFSFGMPYTSAQLEEFLKDYEGHPNLHQGVLAMTRAGRQVERLHLGNLHGKAPYKVVLTARHHACEMMTNYMLEGLMKFVLTDPQQGAWLRDHVEFLIVPFVDKDGVEQGDQGKNRNGRDHNRDYSGESIYASTAALRHFLPVWSDGKLVAALDLHCPSIRGRDHERIHQVGHADEKVWKEQQRFGSLFEKATASSAISYYTASDLPFGTSWNTNQNYTAGLPFSKWVVSLPEVKLASTVEVPYANASGKEVTQNSARMLGKDLALSLYAYLKGQDQAAD